MDRNLGSPICISLVCDMGMCMQPVLPFFFSTFIEMQFPTLLGEKRNFVFSDPLDNLKH